MNRARPIQAVIALVLLCVSAGGCGGALERAAAKDPMKCERDPNCPRKNRGFDCSTQCADDPACVDRCREVQLSSGASGR